MSIEVAVQSRMQRVARNAMVVLGGGAVSAVFALGATSIAAHTLTTTQFGVIVVAQAFALLVERVATCQSWQALIRFGSIAINERDHVALRGLLRFGVRIDVAAAVAGALIGLLIVAAGGKLLDWTSETRVLGLWYASSIALRPLGTALATLRLTSRFSQSSGARAAGHLVRLIGAGAGWLVGGSVGWFAATWIVADIVPALVMNALAWRAFREDGLSGADALSVSETRRRFPDMVQMLVTTSLHSSVKVAIRDVDVLLVGGMFGPAAAALVRIARQFGSAIGQLTDPFMQTVYPELASASSEGGAQLVHAMVRKAFRFSIAAGVFIAASAALLAEPLLRIAAGESYVPAANAFRFYVAAQAVSMAMLPVSPALLALGKARQSFLVLLMTTALYLGIVVPMAGQYGFAGPALALVVQQTAWALLMLLVLRRAVAPSATAEVVARIGDTEPLGKVA